MFKLHIIKKFCFFEQTYLVIVIFYIDCFIIDETETEERQSETEMCVSPAETLLWPPFPSSSHEQLSSQTLHLT